ncbi:MAG TPA: methyltransferase [Candidatus Sumerlaeota bacterium]|nr:methyltransferase [Candidatus Sumerlaeota bacterium]
MASHTLNSISREEWKTLNDHVVRVNRVAGGFRLVQIHSVAEEARLWNYLPEPRTPAAVAAHAHWSERGARMLLGGLLAMGLVEKLGDSYRLLTDTPTWQDWSDLGFRTGVMRQSMSLLNANAARVFDLLNEPRSAEEVAEKLGLQRRGVRTMLEDVTASGLLIKEEGRYRNTPTASICLTSDGSVSMHYILQHNLSLWENWSRLEEAVRTGTAPRCSQWEKKEGEDKALQAFILGMRDIASLSWTEFEGALDLSARRHLLDIGTGPGTYPIRFLKKYPHLQATLFDLPPVVEIARGEVQAAELDDRVSYRAGSLYEDDFGTGYDVILVSNIIHMIGPEGNRALVRKCYDALVPGGLLVIKDFFVADDYSTPPHALIFALNMLVNTPEGDTYTVKEVGEWTRAAGFQEGRLAHATPENGLWVAEKP